MAYRYKYDNRLLAEGERTFVLQDGTLFVRTGVKQTTKEYITYTLREVYDDAVNLPPTGGEINADYGAK